MKVYLRRLWFALLGQNVPLERERLEEACRIMIHDQMSVYMEHHNEKIDLARSAANVSVKCLAGDVQANRRAIKRLEEERDGSGHDRVPAEGPSEDRPEERGDGDCPDE